MVNPTSEDSNTVFLQNCQKFIEIILTTSKIEVKEDSNKRKVIVNLRKSINLMKAMERDHYNISKTGAINLIPDEILTAFEKITN